MSSNTATADPRDEILEHLPSLRAFAVSLTRDSSSADDLVQDTIIKAWKNFSSFKQGTNLRAWLFTILRNTFYSARRKSKREVADVEGVMANSLSEKPAHDGRLQMADFEKAFAKLNDEQREALVLVGASGMTYEEAAETCGVATGTMKSRVNRARAKLIDLMDINQDEALEMTDAPTAAVVASSMMPRKTAI
jgi:RNA polymerase sigma-70 factor, ECF subfamily